MELSDGCNTSGGRGPFAMITLLSELRGNGYSILLRDGEFYVDPVDNNTSNIMRLVSPLKDQFVAARSLVYLAYEVAGHDRKIWSQLLQGVKTHYVNNWDDATAGIILNWIGNNLAYANGLYRNNPADQSFHLRVIKKIEPKVPMALVENTAIAKVLERRLEKLNNERV